MGRIKTSFVKRVARYLLEKNGDKFSTDFETNKKIVGQLIDINSKRIRNIIAGYITSIKKREEKLK
ncbi:MAG: 30S ribosomal protein S17e [Candidatus Aenigmatarchaeota archaeon]